MSKAEHYIPEGHRSITPHLAVRSGLEAIAFYQKAFGAELRGRAEGATPQSTMHAELRIGDSAVFLTDMTGPTPVKAPGAGGAPTVVIHLFVPDADTVFARAQEAGAKVVMPLSDMMWGDRYGQLQDPFGHVWSLATHKEDVSAEELQKRSKSFFAQMAEAGASQR
jgi:uncharacterized glyoxalase superfamily protein PhnB